jgi:hypothetical protein
MKTKPTWPGVSIHTAKSLARTNRQLGRVSNVLHAMRNGCSLHVTHTRDGDVWRLSDGTPVPRSIAHQVIRHSNVEGVGDTLFPERSLSQTWRVVR